LGAEGIGLCRTEHMFFEGDRIDAVRETILASDTAGRERPLAKLLPIQKGDFISLLRVMNGRPVTIRLLDPPLHEFLPHTEEEIAALAEKIGVPTDELTAKCNALHEANQCLDTGLPAGITFPEIYRMQCKPSWKPSASSSERSAGRSRDHDPACRGGARAKGVARGRNTDSKRGHDSAGVKVRYSIGTMIEVPRPRSPRMRLRKRPSSSRLAPTISRR